MNETEQYQIEIGLSVDADADQIAKQYTTGYREDEQVLKEMKQKGLHKFHALEDHNFWIKQRHAACPYCSVFPDSKPMPRSQIKGLLNP